MKLKFPKEITLGSTKFEVKYDKKLDGASFSYPNKNKKAIITIGIQDLNVNQTEIFNSIIHELSEILHVEMYQRFRHQDNDSNYLFSYSHKEFAVHCSFLAEALTKFIK